MIGASAPWAWTRGGAASEPMPSVSVSNAARHEPPPAATAEHDPYTGLNIFPTAFSFKVTSDSNLTANPSDDAAPATEPPTRPETSRLSRRQQLREHLLAERNRLAGGPQAGAASATLARHLVATLKDLEPELIGLYWAVRSEFNAVAAVAADTSLAKLRRALPFARRVPVEMEFRAWDGLEPGVRDDWGIPSATGKAVVPDVVLVPCVGYTAQGYRLGYGGGYFDRWLALHPQVTTIGIAWSKTEIAADVFEALPHDQPLTLVVTERGVVA